VTDEAPEFRWTALPDTTDYRLQLAGSKAFDACYYDEPVDRPATLPLGDVLPEDADTVFWRVRAETDETAPWSEAAAFTRRAAEPDSGGQFLVDAPPVPIRPVHGDGVDADAATLTWEGVPEASGYRVQVASTVDFGDPEVDLTLDETTTLTLFGELPAERASLYWRVQALFPNGTDGPWSDASRFGTDPDVEASVAAEGEPPGADAPTREPERSPAHSPRAAGPALDARTDSMAALVAIAVLVVSFLLTILLIMVV
jgi:hypothetical protein